MFLTSIVKTFNLWSREVVGSAPSSGGSLSSA